MQNNLQRNLDNENFQIPKGDTEKKIIQDTTVTFLYNTVFVFQKLWRVANSPRFGIFSQFSKEKFLFISSLHELKMQPVCP